MARWPNFKQKQLIFSKIGYEPHSAQLPVHQSRARVLLIAGGERAGKSKVAAAEAIARTPWCTKGPRVALTGQEYDHTRAEAEYLIADLDRLGLLAGTPSTPRQGKWEWRTVHGTQFETVSLARAGVRELTGRGLAYDLILVCEAGLTSYDVFLGALGRVSETRGTVIISGTLWDSAGWLPDLYQVFAGPNVWGGEVFALPTWANTAIFPGGEDDPEIIRLRNTLPNDEYARRVAAKLVPSPARIYPEFSYPVHVKEVEYDPEQPVYLAVDPGYHARYAVLALQLAQDEDGMEIVCQIDELWEQGCTHHDIIAMCREREWWPNVVEAVGGHETRQHHSAESTAEVWRNLVSQEGDPEQFKFVTFNAGRIMDGVIRVKTFLVDPGTKRPRYFCTPRCTGTQTEFSKYSRRTNSRGEVTSEEPKDADNDAMDAIRNWLVHRYGLVEKTIKYGVIKPGKRRGTSIG